MSTNVHIKPTRTITTLPLRRALPPLVRDPVNALAGFARQAQGRVVQVNLGPFRPYLVTHPDHVQHVRRTTWANYV